MAAIDRLNTATNPVDEQASLVSASMREEFQEWLKDGKAKKHSPEMILSCFDRISDYAVRKKISGYSLWEYKKHDAFKPVYNRLLEAKLLRVLDGSAYKVFIVAGQLYLRFLKEKPWKNHTTQTSNSTDEQALDNSAEIAKQAQNNNAPTEKTSSSENISASKLLFRKEVDWSLLNYGFTVPQTAIEAVCSNIEGEISRGSSCHIKLLICGEVYPSTLSNVGFACDSRKQLQVRYSTSSPVAVKLREVFWSSYDYLQAAKNSSASTERLCDKEYADIVSVSPDTYGLICFPLAKRKVSQVAVMKDIKLTIKQNTAMTIKDAVICVLDSERRAMTADEIYSKITERGIYTFGAQNPVNVVRTTIEYACENSGYSNQNAVSYFRFERNNDGKKVYSLLTMSPIDVEVADSDIVKKKDIDINAESSLTVQRGRNDDSSVYAQQNVRSAFREWLTKQHPDWNPNTLSMHCSDAYYLYNNDRGLTLAKALTAPDGIDKARVIIEQYYTDNPTHTNKPAQSANGYTRSLKFLKVFLKEEFPELLSQAASDILAKPPQKVRNDELEAIYTCLVRKYSNGFRYDSQIELNKLRRYVLENCDIELALSDVELSDVAKSCGMIFEGKVYVVNAVTREKIKSFSECYFDNGGQVIFYEAFFSKHEDWLIEASVVSEEMLSALFRHIFPQYSFTSAYFGTFSDNINTVIVSEMLRVWDYDILLNYDELSERLVYIPRYRIESALGQNGEFIWNSTATFTHTSKVDLSDSEKAAICDMVAKACSAEQFISFANLPFDGIAKHNTELTETAIHTAVYQICLADEYERSGKIITRRGDGLSALEIITAHCRTFDRITLQDLLDFEKELTGEIHRWVPMQAGYDTMVRVSEDDYVAEKFVHFNITEIDAAIESFMLGEYIPLRAVTTFALFPHCGQPWNLFLLESYARRFSDNFKFDTPSVNNKNAGCIVRKHSKLTYDDIMVDAILKANVSLNVIEVADYLFNNGYRGSKQKAKVSELIKNAKQLHEMRRN